MLAIMFVRAESDAERAIELLHQRHALRRQRRGDLTQGGLSEVWSSVPSRGNEASAERERH